MGTKMEPLKAAMRRVAPPRDHSYRDPYRLVINLAADRKRCGVLGLFILAVSVFAFAAAQLFLPADEMLGPLALSFGVGAGVCFGMWMAGTKCHESLSSIRPLPPFDHDQGQSSRTPGASPAAAEERVYGQEPIEVASNSAS